jgi:hypothetical protein
MNDKSEKKEVKEEGFLDTFNSTLDASNDLDVNDMNEDDVDSMMNEDAFALSF